MKKLCKASVFISLMLVISISLTGCDMSKIGDFVTKIAGVISKIADGIKSFGSTLGGGGTAAVPEGTASATAPIASATAPIASATTPVATGTAVATTTTPVDPDTVVIPPVPTDDEALAVCAANRRAIVVAIERYNLDHRTMMSSLDMATLLSGRYLRSEPKCPAGGTYVATADLTGAGAVACSKHGTLQGVGDTEAGGEEDSPGN